MKETFIQIETKEDLINFILSQSKLDKKDFYTAQKKVFHLDKNITPLELYQYLKEFRFNDTDFKSQLLPRPLAVLNNKPRYFNCAGKVYFFVCLLRWMKDNKFPVSRHKFFISISGEYKYSHIYIEIDIDNTIFPFDFTYDTNQNAFLFPLIKKENYKYRIEILWTG